MKIINIPRRWTFRGMNFPGGETSGGETVGGVNHPGSESSVGVKKKIMKGWTVRGWNVRDPWKVCFILDINVGILKELETREFERSWLNGWSLTSFYLFFLICKLVWVILWNLKSEEIILCNILFLSRNFGFLSMHIFNNILSI